MLPDCPLSLELASAVAGMMKVLVLQTNLLQHTVDQASYAAHHRTIIIDCENLYLTTATIHEVFQTSNVHSANKPFFLTVRKYGCKKCVEGTIMQGT